LNNPLIGVLAIYNAIQKHISRQAIRHDLLSQQHLVKISCYHSPKKRANSYIDSFDYI
jgi:hypothetical protein